jgi:hypothetical protein
MLPAATTTLGRGGTQVFAGVTTADPLSSQGPLTSSRRRGLLHTVNAGATPSRCSKTLDDELRQPAEVLARLARRDQNGDRLSQQPPRHEAQRLRRCPGQPLRIVDDAQQRALDRHLRQQAQHGQPDQKPVRPWPDKHAALRGRGRERRPGSLVLRRIRLLTRWRTTMGSLCSPTWT